MKKAKNSIRKNHCFYWNTSLSNERMNQIDQWIGTFTKEQKKMLMDLLQDERDEAYYDYQEECGI